MSEKQENSSMETDNAKETQPSQPSNTDIQTQNVTEAELAKMVQREGERAGESVCVCHSRDVSVCMCVCVFGCVCVFIV